MSPRTTRTVALLILALLGVASLHALAPHSDGSDHGQPCALCTLFWGLVAIAFCVVTWPVAQRSAAVAPVLVVAPFLAIVRPWSERAPPAF